MLIALKTASIAACAFVLSLLVAPAPGHAQTFPNRPITLICPWPAGGSTDLHLRKLAELASKQLGQPVIVENKPGNAGLNGPVTMMRTAKPDGYTVSQFVITAFRIPHMQKVDWDPLNDFTYILGLAGYTFGVVVRADSPFQSFKDVIAYAKANPGKLSYATPGAGTSLHLAMEEVGVRAGVEFLHIPFKGYADGATALMGGHVMMQVDSTGWANLVDSGKLRLLATLGERRTRWNAPTMREVGVDTVSASPYGLVGPKGMPPQVVKVLHDAFKKASDDPENLKTLAQLDMVHWYKSPEDYARWGAETLKSERATIERIGMLAK